MGILGLRENDAVAGWGELHFPRFYN